MTTVTNIKLQEPVLLDPDRLVELCVEMGQEKAEALIYLSLDHMKSGLAAIEEAFAEQDFQKIHDEAEMLCEMAMTAGMASFARVSTDVAECAKTGRIIPLAATMNRLRRLGEKSINSAWDLGDMMR